MSTKKTTLSAFAKPFVPAAQPVFTFGMFRQVWAFGRWHTTVDDEPSQTHDAYSYNGAHVPTSILECSEEMYAADYNKFWEDYRRHEEWKEQLVGPPLIEAAAKVAPKERGNKMGSFKKKKATVAFTMRG
jgi:hypothetical protein